MGMEAQPAAASRERPSCVVPVSGAQLCRSRLMNETSPVEPPTHVGKAHSRTGSEECSTPGTPASIVSPVSGITTTTSKSHLESWCHPSETLIMLDWDDTLCPSTWIHDDPRLHWSRLVPCFSTEPLMPVYPVEEGEIKPSSPGAEASSTMLDRLTEHASNVAALLRIAASLGTVLIITLAEVGWVEMSIQHFLPSLAGLLEELCIRVVYARSSIPVKMLRVTAEDPEAVPKSLKMHAMEHAIRHFYGTGRRGQRARSWKNVLSIGDSSAEQRALQDVLFRHKQEDSRGHEKKCRCKVLKLLAKPKLEQLSAELLVVASWLQALVSQDDDIDLDFEEIVDEDLATPLATPSFRAVIDRDW